MKRIFIVFSVFLIFAACSIDSSSVATEHVSDSSAYKLFPTTNMWTFIKLDTRNGRIWQVQFDINGENRMQTVLNAESLTGGDVSNAAERFMLYPTQNMYTFMLLDQTDGRTWQVQWNFDEQYRLIVPIL